MTERPFVALSRDLPTIDEPDDGVRNTIAKAARAAANNETPLSYL